MSFDKKTYAKEYYEKNAERLREASRQYRLNHPEWYEQQVKLVQQRYFELKELVYIKLGDACARCGFDDRRALQIDHVNGCGYQERKRCKSAAYLKRVLEDVEGKYQILCANCNWIKKAENPNERSTPNKGLV